MFSGETGLFPEAYVEEIFGSDAPPAIAPPPLPQVRYIYLQLPDNNNPQVSYIYLEINSPALFRNIIPLLYLGLIPMLYSGL